MDCLDEDGGSDVPADLSGLPAIYQGLIVGEEDDVAVREVGWAAEEGEEEGDGLQSGRLAAVGWSLESRVWRRKDLGHMTFA